MKRQFSGFVAGFLCAVMLLGVVISGEALITGPTNIQVSPINIMVNGKVFQPKDANGQPADVFAYNGTTYAPLRALAEAYGLEVGYDEDKKLATVAEKTMTEYELAKDSYYMLEDARAHLLNALEAMQLSTPNSNASMLYLDYVADEFMGIVNNADTAMDLCINNDAHFELWYKVYRAARMYAAICITYADPSSSTTVNQYATNLIECSTTFRTLYPGLVEAFRQAGFTAP